jgi:hypothetical protein
VKEQDLFDYLKSNYYPDLVKAKNQMSRWDCYSASQRHRIELKCRGTHYNAFLIEKKKYDAMILECNKHLDLPMYICSSPKGIYRYNLFLVTPDWKWEKHNTTTTFNNREKIPKLVDYIHIYQSEQL